MTELNEKWGMKIYPKEYTGGAIIVYPTLDNIFKGVDSANKHEKGHALKIFTCTF